MITSLLYIVFLRAYKSSLVVSHSSLVISHSSLVISHSSLVISHSSLVISHSSLVISHSSLFKYFFHGKSTKNKIENTQPPHTCPVGEYGGEAGAHLGDRNKAFSP